MVAWRLRQSCESVMRGRRKIYGSNQSLSETSVQIKEPRSDYTDVVANGSLIFSEVIQRFDD